jgi:peptidyl-prolyl cis-trans isomerase D
MLQNIHDRTKGWIAWVILSLVCVTFALWGIQSYLGGSAGMDKLASVNGVKITQNEVNATFERLLLQLQQQQPNSLLSTNPALERQLKQKALQELIYSQILAQAAITTHYRFSEAQATETILTIPTFQADGQFSRARFQEVLRSTLYSETDFIADLRASLLVNQPKIGLIASEFALPNEVDAMLQLLNQKRDISYLNIPVSRFITEITITNEAIQTYYKANQQRFKTPEKVSIEYLELSLKDLKPTDKQTAEQLFAERGEQLENLTYTHPDTLEVAAKALNLPIQKTALFSRDTKKDEKDSVYTHPKVIAAAFSADVLNQKNNSPLIEITTNRIVVLRMKEHQTPSVQPLDVVKKTIADELKFNAAKVKAEQLGKTILAAIQKGITKEQLATQYQLAWINKNGVIRDDNSVSAAILNVAFGLAPPSKTFSSADLTLPSGDIVVLLVTNVINNKTPTKTASVEQKVSQTQLAQAYGQTDYALYTRELMDKAKVEHMDRALTENANP